MIPGTWSVRQNFLSFWTIFCPFIPLTTQKIKILKKKERNTWIYYHLHRCTLNENHMMYGSWEIWSAKDRIFVILGYALPFYPTNSLKIQNFEKMKKTHGGIFILHKCTKNHDQHVWLLFFILGYFLPFYLSLSLSLCMVSDSISSKIDEIL